MTGRLALALTACALQFGCAGSEPPVNVVLISVDSLRADHLGAYGYSRPTSPRLDRLAEEGIVFDRAYSVTTWTLPSHLSLLSSLYPSQHRVLNRKRRLSERVELISEALGEVGYRSAAVISGTYLHGRFGYDQGWERWDDSLIRHGDRHRARTDVTSERVHRAALEWLDRFGDDPFLLFLHYYDVHYDYVPPPPYDTMFTDPDYAGEMSGSDFVARLLDRREMPAEDLAQLVALYDGEIRWLDEWMGRLFEELRRRGLDERTLVVFTADHGEEFLDHGRFAHHTTLHEPTLRVPLIVRLPGGERGGERSEELASLVDVAPTVLGVLGVAPPVDWTGRDLLSGDPEADEPEIYARLHNRSAILRGPWKATFRRVKGRYVLRESQLFDLDRDPQERENLAAFRKPELRELRRRLQAADRRFRADAGRLGAQALEIDPEVEGQLRALGYL